MRGMEERGQGTLGADLNIERCESALSYFQTLIEPVFMQSTVPDDVVLNQLELACFQGHGKVH